MGELDGKVEQQQTAPKEDAAAANKLAMEWMAKADDRQNSRVAISEGLAMTLPVGKTVATNGDSSLIQSAVESSALARYGYVTVKGTAEMVPGAIDAVTNHLDERLLNAATGIGIGAAMKAALPSTGYGRAIVGTVMGVMFLKDAAQPLIKAYSEASDASSVAELDESAKLMGQGLGAFAVDAAVGAKLGVWAESKTGALMQKHMGNAKYLAFENAKAEFWNSNTSKVGRNLNKFAGWVDGLTARAEERLVGKRMTAESIPVQERLSIMAKAERQHAVAKDLSSVHQFGLKGADGKPLGLSQTIDVLLAGKDPKTLTFAEADHIHAQVSKPSDVPGTMDDALAALRASKQTAGIAGGTPENLHGPEVKPGGTGGDANVGGAGGKGTGTGDAPIVVEVTPPATTVAATDAAVGGKGGGGKQPTTMAPADEMSPETISKLAKANAALMKQWTDESVLVADAVEGAVGPMHAATNGKHKPLDPGYLEARNAMVDLANQVKTPDDLKQVAPLFVRARDAAVQHLSETLGPTGKLAYEMNLFGLEVHSGLVAGMKKAGIPAHEVLQTKNPPLTSVGFDEGAGPHTMRAIFGPKGEPIWPLDHVQYPRNMVDTRSTLTSGIYGHEFGHDQYGGILKLETSIRDNVIDDAINKGLGARKDVEVDVPGHGKMKLGEVIKAIFKAQADENTADIWGAAWTGPNTGGALGVLLQSLRSGGKLETRNVMGGDFVSPENPLGFEVHANDAIRPKIVAATIRARAHGDQKLLDYAKALDTYAENASRSGDYVWANMDKPGEALTISRADLESVVPHLIDAQLNTPLPALKGKTFGSILPDLPAHMKKMDTLAQSMVDAIAAGKDPSTIPFDKTQFTINQVFGAGLPASLRLIKGGMDPVMANEKVNQMSDYLRGLYHDGDPHILPLRPGTLQALQLAPIKTLSQGTGKIIGLQPKIRAAADRNATGLTAAVVGHEIWASEPKSTAVDVQRILNAGKQIQSDAEERAKAAQPQVEENIRRAKSDVQKQLDQAEQRMRQLFGDKGGAKK